MVTAVICTSLHRYVFKSLSTLSIDFRGKRFDIFRKHVSCNLLCCQLVDSVELSSTVRSFLSRYHAYHIFVYLCRVFRHSCPLFLRKSYNCLYRDVGSFHKFDRAYVSPFSNMVKLRLLLKRTKTYATIKRKPIYGYYLLLVDCIEHMLGTRQKQVNYHWFL